MKTTLSFILATLLLSSINMSAQTNPLVGTWHYAAQNSTLVMNADWTFTAKSPTGQSSGKYTYDANNILYFMNAYGQAMMTYTILGVDANQINLQDPYGYQVIYVKQQSNVQPNVQPQTAPTNTHVNIPWEKPEFDGPITSSQGHTLKKSHIQVGVALVEFILAKRLSSSEVNELERASIPEFEQSPTAFLGEIEQISNAMKQLYTLSDVAQIGTARQELFSALYFASMNIPTEQQPKLIQVMNRHVNVLAHDATNKLVLTEADIQGMVNYTAFQAQLSGNAQTISEADKAAYRNQMVALFSQLSLQQKQYLCSASLLWDVMETNWKKMTPQQQQQVIAQYQPQLNNNLFNPNYDEQAEIEKWKKYYEEKYPPRKNNSSSNNTCWECFKIMQNTMTENHVTMMNVINNMGGGSDNYWKVTYDNW